MNLHFEALTKEKIPMARCMSDRYVGENLYSEEDFLRAVHSDKRFFYFLKNEKDEILAYTYFLLMTPDQFLSFSKLKREDFDRLQLAPDTKIGNIQSIAVKEEYRLHRLSEMIFDFTVQSLQKAKATVATGVLWKMGDVLPMKKTFEHFGFSPLADTELVWYDYENMICPYCKGRCVCGARVYYKKLEE